MLCHYLCLYEFHLFICLLFYDAVSSEYILTKSFVVEELCFEEVITHTFVSYLE
jgi:hypothetical protein